MEIQSHRTTDLIEEKPKVIIADENISEQARRDLAEMAERRDAARAKASLIVPEVAESHPIITPSVPEPALVPEIQPETPIPSDELPAAVAEVVKALLNSRLTRFKVSRTKNF
jgi:hypothetical protein